jgi:hypothetical protein
MRRNAYYAREEAQRSGCDDVSKMHRRACVAVTDQRSQRKHRITSSQCLQRAYGFCIEVFEMNGLVWLVIARCNDDVTYRRAQGIERA